MPARIGARRMEAAHTRLKGGGFNFANWRAQQLDGIWLDYTDPDWLLQEPNGPTAVAATNDVIGLALSRRLTGQQGALAAYLAGQPELVTNGGFNGGISGWTDASTSPATFTWDAALQVARLTRTDSNNARMDQSFSTVAGRVYGVSVEIGGTASSVSVAVGSTQGASSLLSTSLHAGARQVFFVADAATTWLRFFTNQVAEATIDNVSVKEVSRAAATQATLNQRLKFDGLNGAICDALDDNHLTNYAPKSGVNFMLLRVSVPASLSVYQIMMGMQAANGRMRLAVSNVSGRLEAGAGNDAALFGDSVDIRGQTINVGLACDGTTVRMFRGDAQVLQSSQNGAVDTAVPFRVGAHNGNGTASSFWGGRILKAGAFQVSAMPDEALWRQISASLEPLPERLPPCPTLFPAPSV